MNEKCQKSSFLKKNNEKVWTKIKIALSLHPQNSDVVIKVLRTIFERVKSKQ